MNTATRTIRTYWHSSQQYVCANCRRLLSQSAITQSGHSKWATIKHDKARADAATSKQRQIHAKTIAEAVKLGGPNPNENSRLALAIAIAKKGGFPKANIETAILRGQGKSSSGAALENVTIEALVPPVGIMIECQTDSKARVLQDVRVILKNHGGTQSPAAFLFERRGRVTFHAKDGVGVDEVLETALEVGALDVTTDDTGRILVDTDVESMVDAEKHIASQLSLQVESSDAIWYPNLDTIVGTMEQESLEELLKLQDELEEYPGVQGVYMNLDVSALENTPESPALDVQ